MLRAILDRIAGKAPPGAKRSGQWRAVRNKYLKENPICVACGNTIKCEVHHIIPFHIAPDLELDENNLITLCESKRHGITCHLFVGHLGNYKKINLSVEADAAFIRKKLEGE